MSGSVGGLDLHRELHQVQGLILNGFKERPAARYAVFEVTDPALARRWIAEIVPHLQFGEYRRTEPHRAPFPNEICRNLAFTYAGFKILGLHETALAGFSLPFQEGMSEASRARRLGDDGPSDPAAWDWGNRTQAVHGVLALFGAHANDAGRQELQRFVAENVSARNGLRIVADLDTTPLDPAWRREPFGFRDGIANPRFAGLSHRSADDRIADGEILLGYPNGYDKLPLSPEVPAEADPRGQLPYAPEGRGQKDFGRNGSYLVFRQLAQDVAKFWEYMHRTAERVPEATGPEWLAARMVGRWQNGTPVTRFPDHPGPDRYDDMNRFLYYQPLHGEGDEFGARCPLGSHIRRTNPRDTALPAPYDVELSGTPDDACTRAKRLKLSGFHRIMRRGRAYGPPAAPHYDCDPENLRKADGQPRGLYFLCFNANLSRQFEFVQSNWAQNPSFAGLSGDPDPLLSAKRRYPFPADTFTLQGCPTRRVHDLPRVVEVRGGAYFFMPSRAALEYIGAMGDRTPR